MYPVSKYCLFPVVEVKIDAKLRIHLSLKIQITTSFFFLFLLLFVCLFLTFGPFLYHLGGTNNPFSLCHVLVGD